MKFFGIALFFFLLVASFANAFNGRDDDEDPWRTYEVKREPDGFPSQRRIPPYCGWGSESCN
ncbi:hypothetical protein TcasGA2_TC032919 [Tribolium castaneum]|uniref:Uncharacterized protein n=1 Tax=Tribolium castaneum TaxID=7070 RepID=A0A139WJW4_TRICA|nr:hypothetical protein TcasGA2_TC032919 [Tribolium castaneum]